MKSVFLSKDINKRFNLVSSICNPFYDNVMKEICKSEFNAYIPTKLLQKTAKAFPRGKARKFYLNKSELGNKYIIKYGGNKNNRYTLEK